MSGQPRTPSAASAAAGVLALVVAAAGGVAEDGGRRVVIAPPAGAGGPTIGVDDPEDLCTCRHLRQDHKGPAGAGACTELDSYDVRCECSSFELDPEDPTQDEAEDVVATVENWSGEPRW